MICNEKIFGQLALPNLYKINYEDIIISVSSIKDFNSRTTGFTLLLDTAYLKDYINTK